jgi:hypothetical protein
MPRITCQCGSSFASHALDGRARENCPFCQRPLRDIVSGIHPADEEIIAATLAEQDEYPYASKQTNQTAPIIQPMMPFAQQATVPMNYNNRFLTPFLAPLRKNLKIKG